MPSAEWIAELEAEVEQRRDQIAALLERVQEPEARLAKDRHNSGKLLSSDSLGHKSTSPQRKSGMKPSGRLTRRRVMQL